MAIEMAGAVYCPLSPQDPPQRLHTLFEETRSRLVLVHGLTRDKFDVDHPTVNIDASMRRENMANDVDLDRLSTVTVEGDSIAYVIFTSGSTGTPKAVSCHHFFLSLPFYGPHSSRLKCVIAMSWNRFVLSKHVLGLVGRQTLE